MEKIGVTVVGKIDVSEMPGRKFRDLGQKFSHFRNRLKERYGMVIQFKEYMNLSNQPFKIIGKGHGGALKVVIEYKGVKIIAMRTSKKNSLLTTALPPKTTSNGN